MEQHEYTNGEIIVIWEPKQCAHAGICIKLLPQVYNPKNRPWVNLSEANTTLIKEQVKQCPSGALRIK